MFALVRLSDNSLPDAPHEPNKPKDIEGGFDWWELKPERPTVNPKREVAIPGDLYADPMTRTVRRLYTVREKTPYELAEDRGLQALKMLTLSDQPMVRALEDAVLFLLKEKGKTVDDLPPDSAALFRKRADLRGQLK